MILKFKLLNLIDYKCYQTDSISKTDLVLEVLNLELKSSRISKISLKIQ